MLRSGCSALHAVNPNLKIYIYIYITDFKQETEIFNSHFSEQCSSLINSSKIPSECSRKSNESLFSITFEINDIGKIIKNFDPNKSHGHDMLSICKLKLCGESIYKLLNLIIIQ